MHISIALALLLTVLTASPAAAQPTIFLVRHAERADTAPGTSPTMAADPDLSDRGPGSGGFARDGTEGRENHGYLCHRIQAHAADRRAPREGAWTDRHDRYIQECAGAHRPPQEEQGQRPRRRPLEYRARHHQGPGRHDAGHDWRRRLRQHVPGDAVFTFCVVAAALSLSVQPGRGR